VCRKYDVSLSRVQTALLLRQQIDALPLQIEIRNNSALSTQVFIALVVVYAALWFYVNLGLFVDPMLQNDDARTALFPYHAFSEIVAFENDPLAEEMLAFMPPAMHAIYAGLSSIIGVYAATKVVQGICLAILLFAIVVGWRSKARAGPYWAGLLIFMLLHTEMVWFRGIGGGLPRALAFPWMILWAAGQAVDSRRVRACAVFGAALTYPSTMLVILGAEGIISLIAIRFDAFRESFLAQLRWLAPLSIVAFIIVAPMLIADHSSGPIHTLEEALEDPAFSQEGRLRVLPFPPIIPELAKAALQPFEPRPGEWWSGILEDHWTPLVALAVGFAFFGWGAHRIVRGISPWPSAACAITVSSVCLYIVSQLLAFRLYSPERFVGFGVTAGLIVFVAEVFGRRQVRAVSLARPPWKSVHAGPWIIMVFLVILAGDGMSSKRNGATIDGRTAHALHVFLRATPETETLIAAHPNDANDVPWWGQRKVLISFETLQPWFVESWARQKKIAFDVLRAMYATDCDPLTFLVEHYDVSHILVNTDRYGEDFMRQALLFEPFDKWLAMTLDGAERSDFILPRISERASVFGSGSLILLDVSRVADHCGGSLT
jgi:hypothetical protein